ncbi:RAI1 like PD-XK nuclease-domain-containing protein [Mucor mucedo]|uniref:RAI1 like PD-XK nuclease-domain-containing protein n=1 Tax=Mucor mucedo TaxID=29922 RepID=UPI00221F6966|nr:RAI1 like PD-XK nuclease-domain-containing protein [Mucor mucedo]KAI7891728.1 RAI1 like PD-XK nuclease-domain-containing protein [Mucor mucedo]
MSKRALEEGYKRLDVDKKVKSMASKAFRLKRTQDYEGSFPVYKQPEEVTSYSIDGERRVWFDNREMKYYYPPTGKDLNHGYKDMVQRNDTISEHLDTLLDALTHVRNQTEDKEKTTADFITWRGIMTKLLCTPYSRKEGWELRATRYNGSIYIEEQTTAEKRQEEDKASDRQRLMSYWGYRFETLSTLSKAPHQVTKGDPELQQRLVDSANTNIQYCIVVKTRLGKNSILMGAEVDCCRDVKPTDPLAQPSNYIELKTSRVIQTDRNQYSFDRYKLLKFWAQSFLVGVPRVICGFRDDDGQIVDVVQYKTLEIPRQVREKPNTWVSRCTLTSFVYTHCINCRIHRFV